MSGLSSLAFRNLWSRKLRTTVTGFGIVLGVATILAFGITNATVENSLNDFFSQTAGDADLTISSSSQGQAFRERALGQATDYPGVILAVGSLWKDGGLRLTDEDKRISLVGIDPNADPQVRSYRLATGRMINEADRTYTLVMVETYAEDHDIQVGDDLEIDLGQDQIERFEVVGLLQSEGVARLNNGAIGFLRLDIAQDLFDEGGRLSQVDLVVLPEIATNGDALDDFRDALASQMGDDYTVAYPSAVGQAIVDSLAGLRAGLGIFSTIALFVGAMLIYNTFAMTVTERTAEIGMLRAVGATRHQILRLVLVEATLLGFVGSVLGLALGVILAIPMLQLFVQGLGGMPLESYTVPPVSVVLAVFVGITITLLAALIPAIQASRISPVEAMRVRAASRSGFVTRSGWKIGLALLAFSLSGVLLDILSAPVLWIAPSLKNGEIHTLRSALSAALCLIGLGIMAPRLWATALRLVSWHHADHRQPSERWSRKRHLGSSPRGMYGFAEVGWTISLALVAQGLAHLTPIWNYLPDASFFILMFVGGTLVMPVVIQLSERSTRHALSLLYGPAGGLGSRNLNRARGRTSLTIGVLLAGATLTIAISSIQVAFDSAIREWVDNTLGGDLTVEAERGQDVEFANQLMAIPGVELATPFSTVPVEMTGIVSSDGFSSEDDTLSFQAVDLPTYCGVAGFQFSEDAEHEDEILAHLSEGDAVLISSVLSDSYAISRGDRIRLRTRRGERDFEVAGVINNFMWGGKSVVGMWSDAERYLGINRVWLFLIKLSPDAEADAVQQAIETRLSRYDDFEVETAVEFRETISRDAQSLMAIFNVVVYIAFLVAGLGVINTMTMNILERVREIGVLRAVGMTRGQVGRMVLAEAGAMGFIGGAFGLAIGWLIAEDMVAEMSRGSSWQFDFIFPGVAFIGAAITAVVISQLAALYPAQRAGGMHVVEAIQHE
jgi:ABC-type antimicrobial peptide transport system permease subunit